MGGILRELRELDDENDRKWRKRELDRLYTEYETSLGATLSSRNKLSLGKEAEIIEIRKVCALLFLQTTSQIARTDINTIHYGWVTM